MLETPRTELLALHVYVAYKSRRRTKRGRGSDDRVPIQQMYGEMVKINPQEEMLSAFSSLLCQLSSTRKLRLTEKSGPVTRSVA